MYDIDFINSQRPTVQYSDWENLKFPQEVLTVRFEQEYVQGEYEGDDIGGLIVYSRQGTVRAVYDYENFRGWVV